MVERSGGRSLGGVAILAFIVTAGIAGLAPAPVTSRAAEPSRPNILIIVTDDQRADGTLAAMPKTDAWFRGGGTWFPNGVVTTPLCCPARASIFSGRFVHNHGVHTNSDPAGVQAFDQAHTMQAYLHASGYRTGMAGKFLNTWPTSQAPPSFDRSFVTEAYSPGGIYNTVRIGDLATSYLDGWNATDDEAPWFLYLAPKAPHSPYTPQAQYAQSSVPPWPGNPAQFEADRSDKPPWVRSSSTTATAIENLRVQQLRTLYSVDDLVDRVMSHLAMIGEENTLAFFLSDNGYFWGEHGISGTKRLPYLDSPRVPFGIRWPGHVAAGATDPRMAANIDLAPTALEAAGIAPPPDAPMDGISLLSGGTRERLLLEYYRSPDALKWPNWSSTLTPTYQYIEWYEDDLRTVSFREYYDLVNDPWQLFNLLGDADPGNDPDVATLSAVLAQDRTCVGASCQAEPVPDTEPPIAPGALVAEDLGAPGVRLTWGAASDNVGVTGYEVIRDGSIVSTLGAVTTWMDASAPVGIHTYAIRAFDGAGLRSPPTADVQVTHVLPPVTQLFSDGFESGTLATWATRSRTTVQSTTVRSGAFAARMTATGSPAYARANLPTTEPRVRIRLWVNVLARDPANPIILTRAQNASAGGIVRILLAANGTLGYNDEVAKVWRTSSTQLPTGWHLLEVELTVGTTGRIRVLLDGTPVPGLDRTENLGSAGVQKLQIGDQVTGRTYDVVVDDVEVVRI
jgi:arylsulfatase A-like enzyme